MTQRGFMQQLRTFEEALIASAVHPTVKAQAPPALRNLARAFRPAAGDRYRRLRRTSQHLTLAAKRVDDAIVGRDAGKLLRSIRTMKSFPALEAAASQFRGVVNRKVHMAKERSIRKREPVKEIGDGVVARRVDTGDHLQSLSERMALCAGSPRWGYRARQRRGELEFWTLLRDGVPIALLSLNPKTREIEECDGPDHEDVRWSQRFALNALRALHARGDDCEAFGGVGAFEAFSDKREVEMQATAKLGDDRWRAWLVESALIVACKRPGKSPIWGQFRREPGGGPLAEAGCCAVEIGQLLDAAAASDGFRELINASRASAERLPRKRRRRRARAAGRPRLR